MLGKAREQGEDQSGALEAFSKSVELDPLSAAAHFDLARLSLEAGEDQRAANHFAEANRLAPDSPYAQQARSFLKDLPRPEHEVQQAGYEIRRFDRSDLIPGLRSPSERLNRAPSEHESLPSPLGFQLESGVLYNTNVRLAPTSRDLSSGARDSLQAFISPELEVAVWNTPLWRAGATFQGYFNANQDDFRSLNLQSYQPGLFAERLIILDSIVLLPRLAYTYTHDLFGGQTFADRHAVTVSNGFIWPNSNESNIYWVTDFTNYANDGVIPAVTSRDGWTNTLGANHRVYFERRWLQSASAGIEAQRAATDGVDFSYNGLGLFTDAEIPLLPRLTLLVNGGWSYRSYPDAKLNPSRNENIWHAGMRLRFDVTEHWSVAAVATHDLFDSRNELFRADRTLVGLTTTFQY